MVDRPPFLPEGAARGLRLLVEPHVVQVARQGERDALVASPRSLGVPLCLALEVLARIDAFARKSIYGGPRCWRPPSRRVVFNEGAL